MAVRKKTKQMVLPDIPNYPDAPLAAWLHYGITDFAGKKVQEELNRLSYPGYLIGIRVAYTVVNKEEPTYVISFGRVPPLDIMNSETDDPLSDDFLIELHETVSALIHKYTPEVFEDLDVEVSANVSGSEHASTIKCRTDGYQCDKNHTGSRKCIQRQNGVWVCKHVTC